MDSNFVEPCRDLNGNISFGEMFRPVNSDKELIDSYGHSWKQVTAAGWNRETDNFFIPMGPFGEYYNHNIHSVESIKAQRKCI